MKERWQVTVWKSDTVSLVGFAERQTITDQRIVFRNPQPFDETFYLRRLDES